MSLNPRSLSAPGWALLAAALLTTGCKSVPEAPQAQQLRAQGFRPPEGKAFVYVIRPSRLERAGTPVELELNLRKFGTLSPKTYLCVAVPPGRYQLKVVSFLQPVSQSFVVEAGQLHFFEVAPKKDEWSLRTIPEPEAREKMAKYRLSGHNTYEAGGRELP